MKMKNAFLCIALACVVNVYAENDLLITPMGIDVKAKSSAYKGDSAIGDSVLIKSGSNGTSFVIGDANAEVLVLIAGDSKQGTLNIKNQYSDYDFNFWAFGEFYELKPGQERSISVTKAKLDGQKQHKTRIISGNLYQEDAE